MRLQMTTRFIRSHARARLSRPTAVLKLSSTTYRIPVVVSRARLVLTMGAKEPTRTSKRENAAISHQPRSRRKKTHPTTVDSRGRLPSSTPIPPHKNGRSPKRAPSRRTLKWKISTAKQCRKDVSLTHLQGRPVMLTHTPTLNSRAV